ncbi:MAG: hypothetical protein KAJ28_10880, partial [Flavobacteriaceae bacterium]|nr:hypothetical protein [Flavobacteriaceae bacterium]
LTNLGVQEMNAKEKISIDGGLFGWDDFVLGAIIGGAIYDAVKYVYTHDVEGYGAWLLANGSAGGAK